CRRSSHPRRLIVKDNRNSIRKEVLHLIKFVKKTVAIPDFKSALFYLAGTLILLVAFWFAGPIYFALLGFSFLFYFQVLLFIHRTQEKVLKKEE
ncbi:hypothetical protein F6X74_06680, partial [Enterococcus faecium]